MLQWGVEPVRDAVFTGCLKVVPGFVVCRDHFQLVAEGFSRFQWCFVLFQRMISRSRNADTIPHGASMAVIFIIQTIECIATNLSVADLSQD